jgi:hypothetical protein
MLDLFRTIHGYRRVEDKEKLLVKIRRAKGYRRSYENTFNPSRKCLSTKSCNAIVLITDVEDTRQAQEQICSRKIQRQQTKYWNKLPKTMGYYRRFRRHYMSQLRYKHYVRAWTTALTRDWCAAINCWSRYECRREVLWLFSTAMPGPFFFKGLSENLPSFCVCTLGAYPCGVLAPQRGWNGVVEQSPVTHILTAFSLRYIHSRCSPYILLYVHSYICVPYHPAWATSAPCSRRLLLPSRIPTSPFFPNVHHHRSNFSAGCTISCYQESFGDS